MAIIIIIIIIMIIKGGARRAAESFGRAGAGWGEGRLVQSFESMPVSHRKLVAARGHLHIRRGRTGQSARSPPQIIYLPAPISRERVFFVRGEIG